jgi:hypothetical protein
MWRPPATNARREPRERAPIQKSSLCGTPQAYTGRLSASLELGSIPNSFAQPLVATSSSFPGGRNGGVRSNHRVCMCPCMRVILALVKITIQHSHLTPAPVSSSGITSLPALHPPPSNTCIPAPPHSLLPTPPHTACSSQARCGRSAWGSPTP